MPVKPPVRRRSNVEAFYISILSASGLIPGAGRILPRFFFGQTPRPWRPKDARPFRPIHPFSDRHFSKWINAQFSADIPRVIQSEMTAL